MIVDLEELENVLKYIHKLESAALCDIDWHRNGEKIYIDPEKISHWRFVGLSNRYFAAEYLIKE